MAFTQPVEGPLFIIGAPRSGTSLLYRVIALHPRAAWISNYNRRFVGLPEVAVLNRAVALVPDLRRRVWFGRDADHAHPYGGRRTRLERCLPQPVEGEALFERRGVLDAVPGKSPDGEQRRLRTDLERLTRAAGGGVLVSKRIGHNRRIPLLAEIFPESRFLVVSRDGRAVARSLMTAEWWPDAEIWWWGGTPRDWAGQGRDPVELAARHWVQEVERIEEGLSGLPRSRVLRASFEALVRSPVDVLEGAAAFSGLGDDHRWRRDLERVRFPARNPRVGARSEDRGIAQIQSVTLRALGYPA